MIYGVWCEFYTRPLPPLWKTAETKTAIKDPVKYVRQVFGPYRTTGPRCFSECFCRDLHLHRTVQLQCNLHYNYCARSIACMLIQSQAIKGRSVYSVVKSADWMRVLAPVPERKGLQTSPGDNPSRRES